MATKEQNYGDFLELCGFEKDEISEATTLVEKGFKRLLIEPEDVKLATRKRIPEFFDLELEGTRKLLYAYVKELIDLAMLKDYKKQGVKIIYGILPASTPHYRAVKIADPETTYVSFPDIFLVQILNSFFHKITPYLETAESHGMENGMMHCELNKMRYGAHILGVLPPADLSWIWGFICDEAPKCEEMIHHFDGTKLYVVRAPHDTPLGLHEDEDDARVKFVADEFREGFKKLQEILGIEVSDEALKRALDENANYMKKMFNLCKLLKADPLPLSGNELIWLAVPLSVPFNTGFDNLHKAIDIITDEVKHRIAKKEGILPVGAPRLLKDNVLPIGTPWVTKIIERFGVGIPYSEALTPLPKNVKPSRFADPYMAAAETSLLRMSSRVNALYRAELICEKIKYYSMNGVLFFGYCFDRWWGTDVYIIKKYVEQNVQVPVQYVEGNIYDDRDYSPEVLGTQLETYAEILKMRRATATGK